MLHNKILSQKHYYVNKHLKDYTFYYKDIGLIVSQDKLVKNGYTRYKKTHYM